MTPLTSFIRNQSSFALYLRDTQNLIVIIPIMVIFMFAMIVTPVPLVKFALSHLLCTPDIFGFVLISTTMTLYTNLVVVDAFLHMLLTDLGARVLVATVAAIAAVVVFDVTGLAVRPMVSVEAEVFVVHEGCRGPTHLSVA